MYEFQDCIILNSLNLLEKNYTSAYELRENPFILNEPHITSSSSSSSSSTSSTNKKRRKVQETTDVNLQFSRLHHESIRAQFDRVVEFVKPRVSLMFDDNDKNSSSQPSSISATTQAIEGCICMKGDLCVRSIDQLLIFNSTDSPLSLFVGKDNDEFIVPALSRFFNNDISQVGALFDDVKLQHAANVLVGDIPWENQNGFRSEQYSSMPPQEIRSCRFDRHSKPI